MKAKFALVVLILVSAGRLMRRAQCRSRRPGIRKGSRRG